MRDKGRGSAQGTGTKVRRCPSPRRNDTCRPNARSCDSVYEVMKPRSHAGSEGRWQLALICAGLLAVAVAPVSSQDSREQPEPDRVYRHRGVDLEGMFDLVCEAALAAAYEVNAREVQTTLDPVTGTPFVCIDDPSAERSDWIEARFDGAELVIDVGPAPGSPGSTTEPGEPGAVAVWVQPRAIEPGDTHSQSLAGRYLAALDQEVTSRLRQRVRGVKFGPTPTPWIGPPLEPTPLGPPELAPRPPIPSP